MLLTTVLAGDCVCTQDEECKAALGIAKGALSAHLFAPASSWAAACISAGLGLLGMCCSARLREPSWKLPEAMSTSEGMSKYAAPGLPLTAACTNRH